MPNPRVFLGLLLLAAACSQDEYGFVATLGNDTTSVERISRSGNRIVSDVVERSPRVIRKHWEAYLADDGHLHSWTMTSDILNPAPGEPSHASYRLDVADDSVMVTEDHDGGARRYLVPGALAVTVPWESYVYGLYELLFEQAAAQQSDSVPVRQYIPGQGPVRGLVRRHTSDSLTFVTGGLAGTGIARMDADNRMNRYSGRFTTYKQEVERVTEPPDIDAIAERFAMAERTAPARSMSARDTAQYRVGTATVTIDYSRPLRRGRTILGDVVPYGAVWRTGANAATQLQSDRSLTIAGLDLAPGKYTVWTLPDSAGAQLIINRQTGQWGTRYNPQHDLGRVALQSTNLSAPVDTFTIRIDGSSLILEWDRFRWAAPVTSR